MCIPTRPTPSTHVRTIEHGNLVDERVARFMAEKGARLWCSTLVTYEALVNEGADYGLPDRWLINGTHRLYS